MNSRLASRLRETYGPWALVTGASSGIGEALARQLAAAGLNLVLVARRQAQLEKLARDLQATAGIRTLVLVADLSTEEGIRSVFQGVENLDIGLVIANAGIGSSGPFLKGDEANELAMLRLNVEAVWRMMFHFSQRFRQTRTRSGMILLSSIVAFQGVPNAAHYAATKAYVHSLGEGVAGEWKANGIDLLVAAPGPVNSGFADTANMRLGSAASPVNIAMPILRALGKKSEVLPGLFSWVMIQGLRTSPRWLRVKIMAAIMGQMTAHQGKSGS